MAGAAETRPSRALSCHCPDLFAGGRLSHSLHQNEALGAQPQGNAWACPTFAFELTQKNPDDGQLGLDQRTTQTNMAIPKLRILLIGNGGREHALAWKLVQSQHVDHIYVVPGNGGTAG